MFVPCPPGTNGARMYLPIISFYIRTWWVRKWHELLVGLGCAPWIVPYSYLTATALETFVLYSSVFRPYFVSGWCPGYESSTKNGDNGTNQVRIMSLRTNFVPVHTCSYQTRALSVPYSSIFVRSMVHIFNSCCVRAGFVLSYSIRTKFVTARKISYPTSFQWSQGSSKAEVAKVRLTRKSTPTTKIR